MQLTGIHHLTAISADAPGNVAFYTRVLGLRLVKKTVNQDDVSAYHLFYGDGRASPGSDITFFDWPAKPERRGTNSVVRTAFRVAGEDALAWWSGHFDKAGVAHAPIAARDGPPPLNSTTQKVSVCPWSTTRAWATPIPGSKARSRPRARSAALGPSP